MNYEVQRCTRRCSNTDRELKPGDVFFSALVAKDSELVRHDYSQEAWSGPPKNVISWWKSRIPSRNDRPRRWETNDVVLEFFEELAGQPDRQDMRYVLALLLVRRRVMRLEENDRDEKGNEMMVLYCPRNEESYKIPAVVPSDNRIANIQNELVKLLE